MSSASFGELNCTNNAVVAWVEEMAELCAPDRVFWCDGSEAERRHLTARAVEEKIVIPLDPEKWPGCYYHRSKPNDVARVEELTFICTPTQDQAGPTNNWVRPAEMYTKLYGLCKGAMRGKTMYVVPYLMGPAGSSHSKVGFELTDSLYVVLSMGIMTRMGAVALSHLGDGRDFNRGLHCMLDVDPARRYIAHFPQDNTIISVGSNYGGNALLGKKCLALRIGSYLARHEGWLAEHMLILGVESPQGEKTLRRGRVSQRVRQDQFRDDDPARALQGLENLHRGRRHRVDETGAPTAGSTRSTRRPVISASCREPISNRTPTRCARCRATRSLPTWRCCPDGDVWWEGKDGPPPREALDWQGRPWTPESKEKAAHPNSRFAAPMKNNPALAPEADDPQGVPISAIIFGGRRATTMPLVYQAFNWIHGVYVGATMGSEMTAAAAGTVGQVRRDPMAMLPFCGYNMGDYFLHWLRMRKLIKRPPKMFHVNWFRKGADGDFLWPGFGENMRVLKWIVDRCRGRVYAEETPLGWMPAAKDIDIEGIPNYSIEKLEQALKIDVENWKREILLQDEIFIKIYADLPKELLFQRELLISRL